MRACDVTHKRQPQTASLRVMDQRIAGAIKLLENSRLFVPLDTDTTIAHFQFEQTLIAIKPDAQKFFAVGIFQCIVDQIDKRARNGFAIDSYRRDAWINLLLESKPLLLNLKTIRVERVAHELGDIGFSEVILLTARFDAREIENVID